MESSFTPSFADVGLAKNKPNRRKQSSAKKDYPTIN